MPLLCSLPTYESDDDVDGEEDAADVVHAEKDATPFRRDEFEPLQRLRVKFNLREGSVCMMYDV